MCPECNYHFRIGAQERLTFLVDPGSHQELSGDIEPSDPLREALPARLQRCEDLLQLDRRLTAIRKGDAQPKDAAEQIALAELCQRYKKHYADAARFYADAFAAKPALTPVQQALVRYNAACAATLAAAGKGEDAARLDAKDKARLHQQALSWLQETIKVYEELLQDADAKTRDGLQKTLRHWQKDADLASVRDKEVLAKLPAAERPAWQQLWADVAKLLKKASAE